MKGLCGFVLAIIRHNVRLFTHSNPYDLDGIADHVSRALFTFGGHEAF